MITAGPKAILDIHKTVELLETNEITSIGYKTDEYPSFYSINSGIFGLEKVETVDEIVELYLNHKLSRLQSSILVSNPVPKEFEIPFGEIETIVYDACEIAKKRKIDGKNLTPFLLDKIVMLTNGKSLKVNVRLALNNIKLGINVLNQLFYT